MVALANNLNSKTSNVGGGGVTAPIALPNTDQSRNYNLDALGNWTSSVYTPEGGSQVTDQRNHNKLNEIIQRTVGTSPAVTFQYDGASGASNGNIADDGTLIYFYDALNRPIELRVASYGGVIAVYTYDAMNRRVRKNVGSGGLPGNVPSGTTDYAYMGNQVMEESSTSNTPIRQFVWGTYIDECIQLTTLIPLGPQNLSPGSYYPLQDLLYRAVALTNASGSILEAYDTDAYGNSIIFTGPGADGIWFTDDDVQSSYGANEIIFCGYRYDPESELYYVRNRTYSPALGRWIQRDPIGDAGGVNLYEYVGGRAILKKDPSGLQVVSPGCPCVPPTTNPTAAEAAEALLAALAAELEWSWIPDVALAAAATAAILLAWDVTCRALYAAYKAACKEAAGLGGCRAGRPCSEYPPRIAAWTACASGRQTYLNAGCDVIIPTPKNHPAAAAQAWATQGLLVFS